MTKRGKTKINTQGKKWEKFVLREGGQKKTRIYKKIPILYRMLFKVEEGGTTGVPKTRRDAQRAVQSTVQ